MTNFKYSNPFSSINIQSYKEKDTVSAWADAHVEQGFCPRPSAISFATTTDDNYWVIVEESDDLATPLGCIFAVKLPLIDFGNVLCIRGGYTDLDISLSYSPRSVTFIELENEVLVIRMGRRACDQVELLKSDEAYSRTSNFLLTANLL